MRLLSGKVAKSSTLREELDRTKRQTRELAQKIQSIEESLKHYQAVLNSAPQMIHGIDDSGKIIFANLLLHQTLGYAPGELVGKEVTSLYPESAYSDVVLGLSKLMETGESFSTFASMKTKSGTEIKVDLASSTLKNAEGKFLHTITICRIVDSEALVKALHGAFPS
jgi:PAS domain S-box-containing protein